MKNYRWVALLLAVMLVSSSCAAGRGVKGFVEKVSGCLVGCVTGTWDAAGELGEGLAGNGDEEPKEHDCTMPPKEED